MPKQGLIDKQESSLIGDQPQEMDATIQLKEEKGCRGSCFHCFENDEEADVGDISGLEEEKKQMPLEIHKKGSSEPSLDDIKIKKQTTLVLLEQNE